MSLFPPTSRHIVSISKKRDRHTVRRNTSRQDKGRSERGKEETNERKRNKTVRHIGRITVIYHTIIFEYIKLIVLFLS